MIDFKQIFSEFKALECISSNEKTFNVISLPEMSHKLGISKERARQIEHQAMEKLQKQGTDLGLEDFLE